ncbi:monovalent cation/H(+) antiporter subunit G [Mycoplasmatota bacterium]|nr:monovalent cation/H(+) antiporter subunit G [Mycoplasmatota bacterium]
MIANILLVIGGLFYMLGGLGVFRMPDTFNRIQAGTKATTLGAFSILLGVGVSEPSWLLKVVFIIILIALTNPIGSSSLAKAAYQKNKLPELTQDDLKELYRGDKND